MTAAVVQNATSAACDRFTEARYVASTCNRKQSCQRRSDQSTTGNGRRIVCELTSRRVGIPNSSMCSRTFSGTTYHHTQLSKQAHKQRQQIACELTPELEEGCVDIEEEKHGEGVEADLSSYVVCQTACFLTSCIDINCRLFVRLRRWRRCRGA